MCPLNDPLLEDWGSLNFVVRKCTHEVLTSSSVSSSKNSFLFISYFFQNIGKFEKKCRIVGRSIFLTKLNKNIV